MEEIRVADKYNPIKIWIIKRYKSGNYYMQQEIKGRLQGRFVKTTKSHLREIGVL